MNENLMPGQYFLGDPTLVLPNKILIGIWENEYKCSNGKFNIYGTHFVVHNTHNGDGIYHDTKNRKYIVDSGIIGLVNIKLIDDINLCKNNGYIFNFTKSINFIYDAGIFIIKSEKKYIKIDTQNLEIYDSDNEENLLNEEGNHISNILFNESDNDSLNDDNLNIFLSDDETEDNNKDEEIKENKVLFNFFKNK